MIELRYDARLDAGIYQTRLPMLFASGDEDAHTVSVALTRDGEPELLAGQTVSAYFIRADGSTVLLGGSASGNVASVTLDASCYVQPGGFSLFIKVGQSGQTAAVFWGVGTVARSTTDTIVDPSDTIPSLAELLAQIDAMEAATTAAQSATSAANTAAGAANTAAGAANTAAGAANSAAGDASGAADAANTAAQQIDNMSVSAAGLAAGSAPTAVISEQGGGKHIAFGIPQGEKGDAFTYDDFTPEQLEALTGPQGPQGETGPQGATGATGATPEITIGTVTTGAPGTDASATITGTPEDPVLNLQIPRGNPGAVQTVNGNEPDGHGNAQLDGLIYETTAQALEAMSQEQQAALYAQGYRAIMATYNDTVTMLSLASDGSLAWVGCNQDTTNLLDNPDFAIAQAGYNGYHGVNKYVCDRWTTGNANVNLSGKTLTYSAAISEGVPTSVVMLIQKIADSKRLQGKNVTFAIKASGISVSSGNQLYMADSLFSAAGTGQNIAIQNGVNVYNFTAAESLTTDAAVTMWLPVDTTNQITASITIDEIALYEGSYTSKTLPPWVAPDPVAELAKCVEYYEEIEIPVDAFFVAAVYFGNLYQALFQMEYSRKRIQNPTIIFPSSMTGRFVNSLEISTIESLHVNSVQFGYAGIMAMLKNPLSQAAFGWVDSIGKIAISADL